MIKSALKLLVILVVGILIYNLFLGTEEEKTGAKKIVGEMKDVGVAVKDLLKAEKEKFDKGKYDKAIDKIGGMLSNLKRNAKDFDERYVQRIEELERKRQTLKDELDAVSDTAGTSGETSQTKAIKEDSKELMQELESLMKEMESEK
jgi:basic membrane lipoprotein Med (substrate-binding protein (PBP1-ABC) superfamily)